MGFDAHNSNMIHQESKKNVIFNWKIVKILNNNTQIRGFNTNSLVSPIVLFTGNGEGQLAFLRFCLISRDKSARKMEKAIMKRSTYATTLSGWFKVVSEHFRWQGKETEVILQ